MAAPRVFSEAELERRRVAYRAWYQANKDRAKARSKKWKQENREKSLAYCREWERKNRPGKSNGGESGAARLLRFEKKAGRPRPERCELCSRVPTGINAACHFDHCHQTGKFRGWICSKCNTGLGLADDSPEILRKMAEYLEKHQRP